METKHPVGLSLLAAVAPVAWGSTYVVTDAWLPPDRPLFAALVRALPIGLVLLALRRQLPHGEWWWRAGLLGVCNIGLFFALIFAAAYRLPSGLAGTVTALSPLVVMALAWLIIGEHPPLTRVLGGVVGVAGVALLVLRQPDGVDPVGLAAALGAVLVSATGFVLVKRWTLPTDLLTFTSWQLVAGGLFLLPVALLVEGRPPALDGAAVLAFGYLGVFGTGVAYYAWFRGLTAMSAGSVALIGLVNPVVATALGVWFAHEVFGPTQAVGVVLVLGGVLAGQRARTRWQPPASSGPVRTCVAAPTAGSGRSGW